MDEEIENSNSENEEEGTGSETGENQENENVDLDALQKEKTELSDKNRQLFERAKKAETEVKDLREKLKSGEETSENKPESQSNEPDYGRLAFLNSKNINHPDDQKIVQDEADRLKLPLTDVLSMEHIQAKLKTSQEEREAKAGMPKGNGRSGGTTPHEAEHWIDKKNSEGEYETPDDQKLAEEVIDKRMNKEKQNKFSDSLYTG